MNWTFLPSCSQLWSCCMSPPSSLPSLRWSCSLVRSFLSFLYLLSFFSIFYEEIFTSLSIFFYKNAFFQIPFARDMNCTKRPFGMKMRTWVASPNSLTILTTHPILVTNLSVTLRKFKNLSFPSSHSLLPLYRLHFLICMWLVTVTLSHTHGKMSQWMTNGVCYIHCLSLVWRFVFWENERVRESGYLQFSLCLSLFRFGIFERKVIFTQNTLSPHLSIVSLQIVTSSVSLGRLTVAKGFLWVWIDVDTRLCVRRQEKQSRFISKFGKILLRKRISAFLFILPCLCWIKRVLSSHYSTRN